MGIVGHHCSFRSEPGEEHERVARVGGQKRAVFFSGTTGADSCSAARTDSLTASSRRELRAHGESIRFPFGSKIGQKG